MDYNTFPRDGLKMYVLYRVLGNCGFVGYTAVMEETIKSASVPPMWIVDAERKRPGKGGIVPPAPLFKAGVASNPAGRGRGVYSLLEWLREMADWQCDEVIAESKNHKSKSAKKLAAIMWTRALGAGQWEECRAFVAEIVDRTIGKPKQSIALEQIHNVNHDVQITVANLTDTELIALDGLLALGGDAMVEGVRDALGEETVTSPRKMVESRIVQPDSNGAGGDK